MGRNHAHQAQIDNRAKRPRRWARRTGAVAAAVALMAAACGTPEPPTITLGTGVEALRADSMELFMQPTTFRLADGVDLAAGEGDAWRWEAPSPTEVADLASRLGVAGEVAGVPEEEGGGWRVGEPGNGPNLQVTPTGSWWASSIDGGDITVSSECVRAEPGPDGDEPCFDPAPPPPADLPPDDEVLATATAVFGEVAPLEIVWRDEWSVTVEADLTVDGQSSGHVGLWSASDGGWYASGLLGSPVTEGPYPTLSAAEAVERLSDSPLGHARTMGMPESDISVSGGTGPDAAEPGVPDPSQTDPGQTDPSQTDPGVIEPGVIDVIEPFPTEPFPTEPIEVTLVGVEATLVATFDASGVAWSLPGYRYTDTEGGTWEAIAVSADYLDESPIGPGTPPSGGFDDAPPGAIGGEPGDGDGMPGDPGMPDDGTGGKPSPDDPSGDLPTLPDVVGLGEAEATAVLTDAGFTLRVIERDGEQFPMTMDYRENRVNLVITDGVVTAASIG